MNIYQDGTLILELPNDFDVLNLNWKKLTRRIFAENRFIQKIVIDDTVFYNDYDVYLLQNFRTIENIEIYTTTQVEGIKTALYELQDYNRKLLLIVEQIADAFYGGLSEESWELFSQFTQGMGWIYDTLAVIRAGIINIGVYQSKLMLIEQTMKQLEDQLRNIQEALKDGDHILVGDLLQFEMKGIIQALATGLEDQD